MGNGRFGGPWRRLPHSIRGCKASISPNSYHAPNTNSKKWRNKDWSLLSLSFDLATGSLKAGENK